MHLAKKEGNYSYADYLTWPEDERWEIIDGIAYLQSALSPLHQEISGGLFAQFYNYLANKSCKIYHAPFCVKLTTDSERTNEDIKKVIEPDITIVCNPEQIDEQGCNGSPDLIIEIISPSSIKMDKLIKFNFYEEAGVKEYWIVEPDGKLVSVFILQEDGRYGRPNVYTEDDKIMVSIFPELLVDLRPVFSPLSS